MVLLHRTRGGRSGGSAANRPTGFGAASDILNARRVIGHHLNRFAVQAAAKGSRLRTDGWGVNRRVAKAGYEHEPIITGSRPEAVQTFPWILPFIGNMKRRILETYHWDSPRHVADYLAEFTYRANRRWLEANLFDRFLVAGLGFKAVTDYCLQ